MFKIKKLFIGKLMEYEAFTWVAKFSELMTHENGEICSYFQHIMPLMLTKTQMKEI